MAFTLKRLLQTSCVRTVLVCTMLLIATAVNAAVTPTVTQTSTAAVTPGSTNQQIIRVQLTNGTGNPTNTVSSMQFTMLNTSNADVSAARLYVTTVATFTTPTQVGATINNPTGTINFTSLAVALNGNGTTRYFWLVFDIASTAVPCNTVDASVPANGIVITGSNAATLAATVQSPAGNRPINGTPTATISASSNSICAGTNVTFTASSNYNGSTPAYQWKLNGSNVSTASTYSNNALANGNTVSVTLTYTATACLTTNVVTSNTVTMTVNPVPVVTATPSSQNICSSASTSVALSSSIVGSTFVWTATASGSISGHSNGNGSSISQTLTNSGTSPGTVTYNAVATSPAGCASAPVSVVVTVNPTPAATATPNTLTRCSGAATSIALSSTVSGASFNWTSVASSVNISGNTNAGGNAIADVLSNNGVVPHTVTYTITPTANSCPGAAITATVTVNPNLPASVSIVANPAGAVCAGTNVSFTATPINGGSTPAYTWKINGNTVGTNSPTFASNALVNGDAVTVTMTSNYACPTGNPATSNTIAAVINPIPNVVATPSAQTICNGTAMSIALSSSVSGAAFGWTATGTSGIGGYSDASGSAIEQTLTNSNTSLGTVTYTITPTANGCTGSPIDVVVTVDPSVVSATAAITPSNEICDGTNVTFTAASLNGGSIPTYQWQLNGTDITGETNATYSTNALANNDQVNVVVTSNAACANGTAVSSNVIAMTVHAIPSAPQLTITTPVCVNETVNLTADGLAPGTYAWSGPAAFTSSNQNPTIANATLSADGLYTAVFTDANGCVSPSASVSLVVNPLPAADAGSNAAICAGASATIGGLAVNGNSYSWSSSPAGFISTNASESVTPTTTTTYTLVETIDATGCTNSNDVVVTVNPLPTDNAGNDATVCDGTAAAIGNAATAGHSYAWTSAPAGFTSSIANPSVTPSVTTTYFLTETILATGCSDTNEVVITVNPVPAANAGTATAICNGEAASIGSAAVAGNSYNWTSIPVGFTSALSETFVSPTVTTTYTLTETIDATGCFNSNSVIVTVNPLPADNAGADAAVCIGNSIAIGAAPSVGRTYVWTSTPAGFTSSAANPTVSPSQNTTYTLTETIDATGCSATNSIVVTVNELPNANAGTNETVCGGTPTAIGAAAEAGTTYAWTSTPAGFTSSVANPTVSPTVTTTYTLTQTITATGCFQSNPVIITVNPLPAANAGGNTSICNNGSSTVIGTTAVVGNTYNWSSNPVGFASILSSETVSPNQTTTYTLVETIDATGCTASNNVVVTVNALPNDNAGNDVTICAGVSTTIGAAPAAGRTYAWTSSPSGFTSSIANPSVSLNTTITYYLVETIVATGCSDTNAVVVTVNPLPAANAGTSVAVCSGQSASIGAASVNDNTYGWTSNPAGFTSALSQTTVAPVVTTTYTLVETITATGCSKTSTVVITVNPLPVVNAGTSGAICLNGSKVLGAAAVAGRTYAWTSNPAGFTSTVSNPAVSPTVTTTYTLTVTITATGCTNTGSVTVTVNPLPDANTGSNATICNGQSASIGAATVAGTTYAWTSTPTGFTSSVANPTVSPTVTTTYTLTQTIAATGCSKSNTVTVTVNPLPAANAGSNTAICNNGSSVTLGAAAVVGNTYAWTSNPAGFTSTVSNPSVSPTITTTYTLTETVTATGCFKSNSVTVTVNALPAANAGTSSAICSGASKQLGGAAVGGRTYAWTSSPTGFTSSTANPTVSPTVTTTYTLVETITSTGCSNTNSVVVTVNPLPAAVTGANSAICNNGSTVNLGAASVAGNTYSWVSNPAGFTSAISNPTVAPTVTTTYTLTETITATGCSKTNSRIITVNPLPVVTAGTSSSICVGQNKQLGAALVAGRTYAWTSNPTGFTSTSANPTVSPTVTTTYTLTVTITATGCTNTGTVAVTVNPVPAANVGTLPSSTVCYGTPITIGAANQPGTTYAWSPSTGLSSATVSNPVLTPTSNQVYTLTQTITATGCSKSNTLAVNVTQQIIVLPYSNTPICSGDTAELFSSANMPLPQTSNNNDFTVLAGTANAIMSPIVVSGHPGSVINASTTIQVMLDLTHYSPNLLHISLVAPNGSEVELVNGMLPVPLPSSPVTFNNPTISASATNGVLNYSPPPYNNTFESYEDMSGLTGPLDGTWYLKIVQPTGINGANSILNGWKLTNGANNGLSYAWSSTPVGFTSNATNPIAFPTNTTTYNVAVTNSANGCTATASTVVVVNPLPVAPTVSDVTLCSGLTATFNATAPSGTSIHWYNTSSAPTPLQTGASYTTPVLTDSVIYYVESKYTTTGCGSARVPVNAIVNPLPNALVADTQDVCGGIAVNIGAASVPGNTYSWTSVPAGFTSNVSNPSATPTGTTAYTLTEIVTATGCSKTNSTLVNTQIIGQWVGLVSTAWDNEINWCGDIPTPTTDVTIASGAPFYPVIVTGVDATCKDLVTLVGGTVNLSGGTLSIYGNFNTISNSYMQSGGQLRFVGPVVQYVNAATAKNIDLDNANGIDLLGNLEITGSFLFSNGLVHTNAFELNVTNTAASAISNFSLARYVNGNLRRSVDTASTYDFPVGTLTKYELAQLDLHNLQGVTSIAAKFNGTVTGSAPNVVVNGTLINALLNAGFWTIAPNVQPASGKYDVTLHERNHTNPALSQQAYTVLKRTNATSTWGHEGVTVGNSQTASGGTVTVPNYGLASFSDFAIGFGNTVLPVTLTDFTVKANGQLAVLDWVTESEYNNDRFDVQRSFDGESFHAIGMVKGQGTTSEQHNYHFVDANTVTGAHYYRLKQVDLDGTEVYSPVRVVEFTTTDGGTIAVYPNPATETLNVTGLASGNIVSIYDLNGRQVLQQTAGGESLAIDLRGLESGDYIVRVFVSGQKPWRDKFMKVGK